MHGGAKFPPPDLDDRSASAGFAVNRLNRMAVRRQDAAYLDALRRSGEARTLVLCDGRTVKGFLVEAEAVAQARDISRLGGWRAYVAQEP